MKLMKWRQSLPVNVFVWGVKPRANKEGGKSEKEKEKEKEIEERGALWMLHILCGIHIIIWASTDSGIFTAK